MATEDKRIDQLDPVSVLDLTSLMAMQQGDNAKKVTLQQLLDYLNGQIDAGNAVLVVLQTLTEEQQHQARLNIRCGSMGTVANSCVASGKYSHAEGDTARARGDYSHAEGYGSRASGIYSHAEGLHTMAKNYCSHVEGSYTVASADNQHVQGIYNIKDTDIKYAHVVGNGTADDARSNAHTLDWDGNAWYAGYVEGTAMILKSPGGKRFSVTVNDSGALTAEEIV